MVTLTVIAVITMMVLPSWRNNDRSRIMAASQILISDIETAQVMTIARPDAPILFRFDPENNKYWLARGKDRDTPIIHEVSGDPFSVTLGEGRASTAQGVTLSLVDCPTATIEFDENGALVDFTKAPRIILTLGNESIEIIVAPTTGTVFEREGGADDAALEDPLPPDPPATPDEEAKKEQEEGGGGLLGW